MAGRIVNLAAPNQLIPSLIVVDTNVITHFLLASFFAPQRSPVPLHIQQATQFFQDLQAMQGTGLVMPSTFIEFVHVAVMGRYKHEINTMTKLQMMSKYGKASVSGNIYTRTTVRNSKDSSRNWKLLDNYSSSTACSSLILSGWLLLRHGGGTMKNSLSSLHAMAWTQETRLS